MSFIASTELKQRLGRVAVIFGGNSSERPVSLKSGQAVLAALIRAEVDAFGIDLFGEDGGQNPIEQLTQVEYDRAFLILHGPIGEDGTLQGVLEMLGKPYTGSGVAASALGMDKLRTKQLWLGAGLPTPEFAMLTDDINVEAIAARIGYPMIIKPAHEGSSIGMSKVNNFDDFTEAYSKAAGFDRSVLAERWMSGNEYTVAVLNGEALPPILLKTKHEFYDFEAKYISNETEYCFENDLSDAQVEELKSLSVRAFETVGCQGWGRVDVMQDAQGNFQLLEINTAPGMTDHSLVPMAAAKVGISFEQLVVDLLSIGLE